MLYIYLFVCCAAIGLILIKIETLILKLETYISKNKENKLEYASNVPTPDEPDTPDDAEIYDKIVKPFHDEDAEDAEDNAEKMKFVPEKTTNIILRDAFNDISHGNRCIEDILIENMMAMQECTHLTSKGAYKTVDKEYKPYYNTQKADANIQNMIKLYEDEQFIKLPLYPCGMHRILTIYKPDLSKIASSRYII